MVFANHLRSRITPAYAGQILLDEHSVLNIQDHPRIRGTNGYLSIGPFFLMGSSPHTRDKFEAWPDLIRDKGIIPAYAGQIVGSNSIWSTIQDHPRIRGTNRQTIKSRLNWTGSSPHTRDKSILKMAKMASARIIPAYAGQITAVWAHLSQQ